MLGGLKCLVMLWGWRTHIIYHVCPHVNIYGLKLGFETPIQKPLQSLSNPKNIAYCPKRRILANKMKKL